MISPLRSLAVAALVTGMIGAMPAVAQEPAAAPPSPVPAETPPAPEAAPPPAASAAPAVPAAPAASGKISAPPEGKGQVVFFRPSRFVGAAVSFSVHEGEKGIGKLGNGSYFVLTSDPGPHEYTIQFEAKDTLHMEVEAGETYYVQQTIGMGVMAARPHLTPSDQASFDKLDLKQSTKKPTDLKPKGEKAAS